ncbi:hypothetical protein HKCCSP123_06210 [Rhodobacterales bacterium HKCCSP123]|nr:hypothetical protein [Rhodobacterales bacterium HKCCSP123]
MIQRAPRRYSMEQACELLELTEPEIGALIATGRLPQMQEHFAPGKGRMKWFDGPAFTRAVARIAEVASRSP